MDLAAKSMTCLYGESEFGSRYAKEHDVSEQAKVMRDTGAWGLTVTGTGNVLQAPGRRSSPDSRQKRCVRRY